MNSSGVGVKTVRPSRPSLAFHVGVHLLQWVNNLPLKKVSTMAWASPLQISKIQRNLRSPKPAGRSKVVLHRHAVEP